MKKLFFCARDSRDYLKEIMDVSKFEKVYGFKPTLPEFNDAPVIQEFLFDLMKIYPQCEEGCDAPIYNETGIEGLRLDFNFGLRLDVPAGNFHVRIGDDSGQIFFDRDISAVRLISVEKYFIHWHVEVFHNGEKIFEHDFNPEGQSVLMAFRNNAALGDTLAMLPAIEEFGRRFKCEISLLIPEYLKEITAHLYPEIKLVDKIDFKNHATFYLSGIISPFPYLLIDPRNTSIEKLASSILELKTPPAKPIFQPTAPKISSEPYVCIGVQASTTRKGWHYPGGWKIIVDYLQKLGYRVFCIDKEKVQSDENYTTAAPANAEDFTGDFSILERANMLYHAEFFIGLSSGLAWVADAVNCPVVMICGFSQDWYEFYTPYRVANRLVCNGCFNDTHVYFIKQLCPYHHGTPRELECQKKISPRVVIDAINRLILDNNLTPPIARA